MAQKSSKNAIVEESEELMIPPTGGISTVRTAHFLLPTFSPISQQCPKPPSVTLSSTPNISQLKQQVAFNCLHKPQQKWKAWVDSLLPNYQKLWENAGIFHAIRVSTYPIKKQPELILCLAHKWCPETNTFVFPWGEATVTLEDMMIIGGYSVLGESVSSIRRTKETMDMERTLNSVFTKLGRENAGYTSQSCWLDYFMGRGDELEHVALLVLWLKRFLFPGKSRPYISKNVFSLAIRLSKGIKITLAPAVLASIYRDLRLLKQTIVDYTCNNEDLSTPTLGAQFQLIQLWAWERFPELSPETRSLYPGDPRLRRWKYPERKLEFNKVNLALDSAGESFLWRPYTIAMKNWQLPKFYPNNEMSALMSPDADDEFLAFSRCLKVVKLVGFDCVEQYFPHRVAMQFGIDQDIPVPLTGPIDTWEDVWNPDEMTAGNVELYLPPRLLEPDVTKRYFEWWYSSRNDGFVVHKRRRSFRKFKRLTHLVNVGRQCDISTAPLDVVKGPEANVARQRAVENDEKVVAEPEGSAKSCDNLQGNVGMQGNSAYDHVAADQAAPTSVNSIALKVGALAPGSLDEITCAPSSKLVNEGREGAATNKTNVKEENGREYIIKLPLSWARLEEKIGKLEILAAKMKEARFGEQKLQVEEAKTQSHYDSS